jgi:hypothetical protein
MDDCPYKLRAMLVLQIIKNVHRGDRNSASTTPFPILGAAIPDLIYLIRYYPTQLMMAPRPSGNANGIMVAIDTTDTTDKVQLLARRTQSGAQPHKISQLFSSQGQPVDTSTKRGADCLKDTPSKKLRMLVRRWKCRSRGNDTNFWNHRQKTLTGRFRSRSSSSQITIA